MWRAVGYFVKSFRNIILAGRLSSRWRSVTKFFDARHVYREKCLRQNGRGGKSITNGYDWRLTGPYNERRRELINTMEEVYRYYKLWVTLSWSCEKAWRRGEMLRVLRWELKLVLWTPIDSSSLERKIYVLIPYIHIGWKQGCHSHSWLEKSKKWLGI